MGFLYAIALKPVRVEEGCGCKDKKKEKVRTLPSYLEEILE